MSKEAECVFNYLSQREDREQLINRLGLNPKDMSNNKQMLREYINLKLMSIGQTPIKEIEQILQTPGGHGKEEAKVTIASVAEDLIASLYQAQSTSNALPGVDQRLQRFLDKEFPSSVIPPTASGLPIQIPAPINCFQVDRANVAFELACPYNSNIYEKDGNTNLRIPQGMLSNPKSDKRSTVGTFHVGEGGNTPIPNDKMAVPKNAAAFMMAQALNPPKALLELPYTSTLPEDQKTYCWTSLYVTPPVIPGLSADMNSPVVQKYLDVRYLAPASCIANLSFVEQIFCNAGNPLRTDLLTKSPEHHSGCQALIILAPHLTKFTKKECGLPHFDQATDRQKRDGMCYKDEKELYNDGRPFKLTYRSIVDQTVVTILADTYFGYSKKEIKTIISFATNVLGFSQEEHAGGCYASPCESWGFYFDSTALRCGLYHKDKDGKLIAKNTFAQTKALLGKYATYYSEKGYLQDKNFKNIVYLPENVQMSIASRNITYTHPDNGKQLTMKISASVYYVLPNGYQIQLLRNPVSGVWQLVGTTNESKFLFKPASVSGGGKSELSKSVMDAVTSGPFFVRDFAKMITGAADILKFDFTKRFKNITDYKGRNRHILAGDRPLSSVIILLTPDDELYTPEYNKWLRSLDAEVLAFVYLLKVRYHESWGSFTDPANWQSKFKIDKVNGQDGFVLKCENEDVVCNYLRLGQEKIDGKNVWRNFRLRQDFFPAVRFQNNDDIGVTAMVAGEHLNKAMGSAYFDTSKSYKLSTNCEYHYFQRPDDACHPGVDKKAEQDLGRLVGKTFISNFEPCAKEFVQELAADNISVEKYSPAMQNVINSFSDEAQFTDYQYCVVSSQFRITDKEKGKRSDNVRYLQTRDELIYDNVIVDKYLMELRQRLNKQVKFGTPVIMPVDVYVPGRRLNTVDPKNASVRPLSAYGPMHWQPIPLLMLDWITSLSGKSPSTTGSGSLEGALTKGPFNNLLPAFDMNTACLALALGQEPVFTTPAGSIGHKLKVDHDITLIIPEILSRIPNEEMKVERLIKEGFLEQVPDMEHAGKKINSSILGYRVTSKFIRNYFSTIFDSVDYLLPEEYLRPELQSMDNFANAIEFIYANIKSQVESYYLDGSYNELIPPLQLAFDIVKNNGTFKGMTLNTPEFLKMFEREEILKSAWYKQRLVVAQRSELAMLQRQLAEVQKLPGAQISKITERITYVKSDQYLKDIVGTLGSHVFASNE